MKGLTSRPNIHRIVAGFNTDEQECSDEEQQARGYADVSHHGFLWRFSVLQFPGISGLPCLVMIQLVRNGYAGSSAKER